MVGTKNEQRVKKRSTQKEEKMLLKLGFILFLASACRCDDEDAKHYRLHMESIIIDTYTIHLEVPENFHESKLITGDVHIKFTTSDDKLKIIRIHSGPDITFDTENVALSAPNAPKIEKIERNGTFEMAYIALAKELTKDTNYTLHFNSFTTKLSTKDMYGFYLSSYNGSDGKVEYLATTQFEPTYARRAFPCFDEPSYKAKFTISIKVPTNYTAVSNTPAKLNGQVFDFEETPIMSSYLVAFMVSQFKSVDVNGVPSNRGMKIYVPTEEKILSAAHAQAESHELLKILGNLTSTDFWDSSTFKKLDQAAIPDFSVGAMENWGLVTYSETELLHDNDSTTKNMQRVTQIIAHEFAHMWFGNLLTTAWWNTTWLNEGFATYFEYFAPAELHTDWDFPSQFVVEQVQSIMTEDGVDSARALTSEVNTPTEVISKFDSITYNKGASVIRMMKKLVGDKEFEAGLKEYLAEPRFAITTPKRLFDVIQKHAPQDMNVTEIMGPWTTQSGYPVIKAFLLPNKTVTIKQEHFIYSAYSEKTWIVPVWYKTKKTEEQKIMTTDNTEKILITKLEDDDYLLINPDQIGYYRVQYDAKLLERLLKVLRSEETRKDITPVSRAQIVDDIMNLARASKTKYPEAIKAIDWLAKETDYFPWYSAFNSFDFLRMRLPEGTLKTKLTEHLETLMKALYDSNQNNVTTKATTYADEPKLVDTYKRVLAYQWSCEIDNEQCKENAMELMYKQINGTANDVIAADLRSTAYCSAARHDKTDNTWNYLWNRFQGSNSANENVTIITALGCSTNKEKLSEYLINSLDNGLIKKQDAYSVFTAVLKGNPGGVQISLDFLNNNFNNISASYGSLNALSNVIKSIGDRLTKEEQITALKKTLEAHKEELDYPEAAAAEALATAQANLAWSTTAQDELNSYFFSSAKCLTISQTLLLVPVVVFSMP